MGNFYNLSQRAFPLVLWLNLCPIQVQPNKRAGASILGDSIEELYGISLSRWGQPKITDLPLAGYSLERQLQLGAFNRHGRGMKLL